MKFNFTVDISDCDGECDVESEILDRATKSFMQETLGNYWDDNSMSCELKEKIENKIDEICTKDFKDVVTQKVIDGLTEKVERSKQYKELVKGQEICSDAAMKTGLKDIVAELVKSDMKKVFNA